MLVNDVASSQTKVLLSFLARVLFLARQSSVLSMLNTSPGKKFYLTRQNMLRPSQLSAFYLSNSSDFYMCNSMYFVLKIKCLGNSSYHRKHFSTLQQTFLSKNRSICSTLLQRIISVTRSISLLPSRQIHQILEAFQYFPISKYVKYQKYFQNQAIIFVGIRQ